MSRDLVERGGVKLTRYWAGTELRVMYQLTIGTGFVHLEREEMEFLLIELLTALTNEP